MKSDWIGLTVSDIAAPVKNALVGGPFGSNLVSKDYAASGVPVIRGQNMGHGRWVTGEFAFVSESKAESLVANTARPGDLVFTQRGTLGQVAIVPQGPYEKYIVSQSQMKLTVDSKKTDVLFLYYLFTSPEQLRYIQTNAIQVGVPHTNLGILRDTPVSLPDLETQKEIAAVLSSLDDKIELNRQINQTLEQIAQAIFKSWFVDFEPVNAKIEAKQNGQDPERAAMRAINGKAHEQLDQLSPEQRQQLTTTTALFPDELVESELGEIPKGWGCKPFGELLEKTIGGDWGKEEPDAKHTEKVRILRGTDLPNVYTGNDTAVPVRYVEAKKLKTRKIKDGNIVIEVSGGSPKQPTGRSLYITEQIIERLGGVVEPASFCRLFRPINKEISLLLSVHLSKIYSDGKTWLYQNQSTGISNFQTKVFLDKELVVVPNEAMLAAFYEYVRPIYDKMYSSENSSLANIRDSLLPKLLSGEIEVEAA